MNEFIVWDKKYLKFLEDDFVLFNGMIYRDTRDFENDINSNDLEILRHIGKTDINNKKIFADSSIVEFNFLPFGETETVTYKGFVKYNQDRFRFEIEVISHCDKDGDNYIFDLGKCIDRITNIKIIDTIQENKLGLIK